MVRIFGPVPSRRLGNSLGIDLVPFKTCTFDCIYCECGKTTSKTCTRAEFYPIETILAELEARLSEMRGKPDVLTLSGAGEPTLYSRTGELIETIKRKYAIPVAVITNSSLLGRPAVRDELKEADIILPSLDAATRETFLLINRPHESCSLEAIIGGIETFLGDFRGTVLFEILLVQGINTDEKNLGALRAFLERLRIDRIQLNTAVRPGTEKGVMPLGRDELGRICSFFGPRCGIATGTRAESAGREDRALEEKLLGLIGRRPCTVEDIHRSLGLPVPAVVKLLATMGEAGAVLPERHGDDTFYTAANRGETPGA